VVNQLVKYPPSHQAPQITHSKPDPVQAEMSGLPHLN
jgi:hypothetical protein